MRASGWIGIPAARRPCMRSGHIVRAAAHVMCDQRHAPLMESVVETAGLGRPRSSPTTRCVRSPERRRSAYLIAQQVWCGEAREPPGGSPSEGREGSRASWWVAVRGAVRLASPSTAPPSTTSAAHTILACASAGEVGLTQAMIRIQPPRGDARSTPSRRDGATGSAPLGEVSRSISGPGTTLILCVAAGARARRAGSQRDPPQPP